jgi:hypothetical protein
MDPHEPRDVPPDRPLSDEDFRAGRLGFALRRLAGELVAERERVKQLRKENRELRSRLDDRPTTRPSPKR